MKLTQALKSHARTTFGVDEKADDAAYIKAVGAKLVSGELTPEKFAELTAGKLETAGKHNLAEIVKQAVDAAVKANQATAANTSTTLPASLQNGNGPNQKATLAGVTVQDPAAITVNKASARYSEKRWTGRHKTTGQPVTYQGREVELPSEQMYAKLGAFMRWKGLKAGIPVRNPNTGQIGLDEHEKQLVLEMANEDEFVQDDGDGFVYEKGAHVKALLDDSTSGGQELVPIWFDDMVVTFPLLHSELFPFVQIREVPRSSRVEAASIGNPTVSWGTAEGSSVTVFSTTALAAAIDTTIHPVVCILEQGIDFLSDSPVNVGQQVQDNIGQAALKEWDNVIVNGNGTNRPQGLDNATAGTTVVTENGASGPWTVADLEALIFGLGKQYRAKAWEPRLVCNDTTYRRWRAIQVSATDERRVFGMDHQSYQILDYKAAIQNDLGNGKAFMTCLGKYRLYRRRGFDMRLEYGGATLARTNTMLIVGRGRMGGKIVDSSALAKTTTGQS